MRIIISVFIIILALVSVRLINLTCDCEDVDIFMWNAQNLGPTKLEDGRLDHIARIASKHDIIILQEVTDASGNAAKALCAQFESHTCRVSQRTGTNRKEQFVIASRLPVGTITMIEHPSLERGVASIQVLLSSGPITLLTTHLKPDRVSEELDVIETLITDRTILIGDLNADCSYLTRERYLNDLRWIVTEHADTTVSESDCAYDRAGVTRDLLGHVRGYRIESGIAPELSDHKPIVLVLAP